MNLRTHEIEIVEDLCRFGEPGLAVGRRSRRDVAPRCRLRRDAGARQSAGEIEFRRRLGRRQMGVDVLCRGLGVGIMWTPSPSPTLHRFSSSEASPIRNRHVPTRLPTLWRSHTAKSVSNPKLGGLMKINTRGKQRGFVLVSGTLVITPPMLFLGTGVRRRIFGIHKAADADGGRRTIPCSDRGQPRSPGHSTGQ